MSTTEAKVTEMDFDKFIHDFQINDIELFKDYLGEIWLDLRLRSDDMDLGVSRVTFFDVI